MNRRQQPLASHGAGVVPTEPAPASVQAQVQIQRPLQRDWWRKSIAGVVGGFLLALGLSGLFAWWGPGGIDAANKSQFVMWLITPIWLLVMALVYLFRTGNQALLWLTVANGVVYGCLWLARATMMQG